MKLDDDKEEPEVVAAVFIEQPTPFFDEFLEKLEALDYSKSKIDLFIHNNEEYHAKAVNAFIEKMKNVADGYNSVRMTNGLINSLMCELI